MLQITRTDGVTILPAAFTLRIYLMAAALLALGSTLDAATIKNLKTGQKDNRAFAEYDLIGKPGEKETDIKVSLEVGGEKYDSNKLSLSGDFGKGVRIGRGKIIYWDLLKDMPTGFEGEIFWDLESLTRIGDPESLPPAAQPGRNYIEPITSTEFVLVPKGCFEMGDISSDTEPDERPVHEVCLESFHIGKYEITQSQWQTIMGTNPSYFRQCGKSCPVENISWSDAGRFIKKLNSKTGKTFRLPTEAEWEYAAKSGGRHKRYSGTEDSINTFGWHEEISSGAPHPVGQKMPNLFGIHDMSGNVAEWVQDWKGEYTAGPAKGPTGPGNGKYKVFRGGSWLDDSSNLRTTYRSELDPKARTNSIGLRLALPAP